MGRQFLGVGVEPHQGGGRAQQDRQDHEDVHHDAAEIDRYRADDAGQAVLHQVSGIVAKVTDFRRFAVLLIEPAERKHVMRRHSDRQRGADIAAARNGRKIIHLLEGLLRLKTLQYAETERCGANAAARTGDAGQLFRRAWIAGVVRPDRFACSLVMAVANGAKLRTEDGFEINGLCHRSLDTDREFVNCRRRSNFNRPGRSKNIAERLQVPGGILALVE